MKKFIILAIATLSTGIVLSSTIKKNENVAAKAITTTDLKKDLGKNPDKSAGKVSYDAVATAD